MDLIDLLISKPSTGSHSLWYTKFSTINSTAARGWRGTMGEICIPNQMLFSQIISDSQLLALPFSSVPPPQPTCQAVQNIFCIPKPIIPKHWLFSLRQSWMQVPEFVHTHTHKTSTFQIYMSSIPYAPI